ncbi:MAG TPA: NTP transferase domain-containing protein [Pelagibacterium sp.]|uniref:molybdenum cofactor guanylyltransferase n=1 Tax=Pelagibacterium sp. TaxID=1967288 RepID=UPI002BAF4149|nr:NTP transferase domain-containing protein [Pelagibacterium sp.]HWJ87261.1 NTP transferase domain-containing protein [Pelagibacterium sp.]
MGRGMVIVGLILAGGSGVRLGGVRKADLRLGNVSLLQRVTSSLRGQCAPILLSTGSTVYPDTQGLPQVPDAPDAITGPAAGLLAGALWCKQNQPGALLLSVSVDTPFFPADFAARASRVLDDGCACVVSAYGERTYPTNAIWRSDSLLSHLSLIPPAPRGPRLRDIEAALAARHLDYGPLAPADPFLGVNRMADLLALSARIAPIGP